MTVGPERRINNIGLAVKLLIPWDLANRQHEMVARLVNEDGQPVIYEGNLVEVRGSIEVGRPPGLKPGTDLDAPMALNFQGLQLASGRFTWELLVDGSSLARATFEVIGP